MIHVMAAARLGRAAMAPPVMGDHTEALAEKEEHLSVPIVRRERPAMAEHDGLTRTPVLVENIGAVPGGDRGHVLDPFGGVGSRASLEERSPRSGMRNPQRSAVSRWRRPFARSAQRTCPGQEWGFF